MKNMKHEKRAHKIFTGALVSGKIKPLDNCEECGAKVGVHTGTLHGHHEDYKKPLKVRWLCPSCHKRTHFGSIGDPTKKTKHKDNYVYPIAYRDTKKIYRAIKKIADQRGVSIVDVIRSAMREYVKR